MAKRNDAASAASLLGPLPIRDAGAMHTGDFRYGVGAAKGLDDCGCWFHVADRSDIHYAPQELCSDYRTRPPKPIGLKGGHVVFLATIRAGKDRHEAG